MGNKSYKKKDYKEEKKLDNNPSSISSKELKIVLEQWKNAYVK